MLNNMRILNSLNIRRNNENPFYGRSALATCSQIVVIKTNNSDLERERIRANSAESALQMYQRASLKAIAAERTARIVAESKAAAAEQSMQEAQRENIKFKKREEALKMRGANFKKRQEALKEKKRELKKAAEKYEQKRDAKIAFCMRAMEKRSLDVLADAYLVYAVSSIVLPKIFIDLSNTSLRKSKYFRITRLHGSKVTNIATIALSAVTVLYSLISRSRMHKEIASL